METQSYRFERWLKLATTQSIQYCNGWENVLWVAKQKDKESWCAEKTTWTHGQTHEKMNKILIYGSGLKYKMLFKLCPSRYSLASNCVEPSTLKVQDKPFKDMRLDGRDSGQLNQEIATELYSEKSSLILSQNILDSRSPKCKIHFKCTRTLTYPHTYTTADSSTIRRPMSATLRRISSWT